jgi:hypothetical protein
MGLFLQEFEPLVSSAVTPEINIINTVDEYIAEVVLDHKDAVPEAKEHSKKDIQIHKHAVSKLINLAKPAIVGATDHFSNPQHFGFSETYNYHFFEDITPPPPKQVS